MSSLPIILGRKFHADSKDDSITTMRIIPSGSMLLAHPFLHLHKPRCKQVLTLQVDIASLCQLQVEIGLWLESEGGI